jgi:hypothetical protein
MEMSELINAGGTAYWRRNIAEQFPEDHRNLSAAEMLERFDNDLSRFNNTPTHHRLETFVNDTDEFNTIVDSVLKSVGFNFRPKTCDELLTRIVELLEDTCRRGGDLALV